MQTDGHQKTDVDPAATTKTPDTPLARLLRDARLRLVETGTRNRLVHTPRGVKRSRSIALTVDDRDAFFETAVRGRRLMRFMPREEGAPAHRTDVVRLVDASASRRPGASWLHAALDPEILQKKLLSLYRDARTAEEGQGINILFLAFGAPALVRGRQVRGAARGAAPAPPCRSGKRQGQVDV